VRCLSIAYAIAAAAGTIAAGAGSARAGGSGAIVLAAPDQRAAVATAIATAVRESRPGRVVDDAVAEARAANLAGAVPIDALQRFRGVRDTVDEGWRAYHGVQLDFAASRLAAARTDAEALLALPGGTVVYADASLRLGAVLAQLGRAPAAHDAIALALALDPERPITAFEFSPDTIAVIDGVRAQQRPTRPVKITTEPAGASLTVDGKDAGSAPAAVALAPGEHVVIARAPMYHARAQAFAVDATTADLALTLDSDDEAQRLAAGADAGMADATAQQLVDATAQLADLDEVVLAAETDRRGGPTLLVQRCAGAPAKCTAVVEISYADRSGIAAAARSAWQELRTADLRYAPTLFGDPRLTGQIVEHRCKLCRSPIVWAGVGVVAVAATIAIIAVATSSKPPPILGVDSGQFTTP
jgi:hypothetical protein